MLGGSRGMLAAHQPLVVPMLLRLSNFKLNAYVVLVLSKQKGITLVFKTDPLQNVDVNSTFDSIAVIQKYIQREIEGQLREMFREDLPGIIHRLSQRWVTGKTKVEAPYLSRQQPRTTSTSDRPEISSTPDMSTGNIHYSSPVLGLRPILGRQPLSRMPSLPRMQGGPSPAISASNAPSPSPTTPSHLTNNFHDAPTTFPEIENFDPTYGLRPEDLPAKSRYNGFGRLFSVPKGLGDLAEEDEEAADSFDIVDWDETVNFSPPPSIVPEDATEYETLPAVGGGTITRPRVYHSQSVARPPTDASSTDASSPIGIPMELSALSHHPSSPTTSGHDRIGSMTGASTPTHFQKTYFSSWPDRPQATHGLKLPPHMSPLDPRARLAQSPRAATFRNAPAFASISAGFTHRSRPPDHNFLTSSSGETDSYLSHSNSAQTRVSSTPPSDVQNDQSPKARHIRQRSLSPGHISLSESMSHGSPPNVKSTTDAEGNIVLHPGLNNTISQLSTLSHSNHTLSPYTRSLEHFTVRSVPHIASASSSAPDRLPMRAKRRRMYRLGGKQPPEIVEDIAEQCTSPSSPTPPPEFEASDVEHYFPVRRLNLRRRASYQDL